MTFLGRPRTRVAANGGRDRQLLARRHVHFGRALPRWPESCPACSSTRWRRSRPRSSASACRCRSARNGCRSYRSRQAAVPMTGCWSFCSCHLGQLAAFAIHRLASDRLRRAPAWDCGYPDASPATQYTAMSFAQPIRRVFGTVVFRAREQVEMPPPGDTRPARLTVQMTRPDLGLALCAARRRHQLRRRPAQPPAVPDHPPISQLVFCALVVLLLVLAVWS